MQIKWLEDFISLAETRSFSRSALLRHLTPSAFSRRIQALEHWAGTSLVDRNVYPMRLTPAGEVLYDQSPVILSSLRSTRAMLRNHDAAGREVIEFAMPHALAFSFFPAWLGHLRARLGLLRTRVTALNVQDAARRLVDNGCDFLIAYHHEAQALPFDASQYDMISLGQEVIAPFARADSSGAPLFSLPGHASQTLPLLAYAPESYLGQVVNNTLRHAGTATHLHRVYETAMAESLKAMALQGHGIAFLPVNAIQAELRLKQLVSAGEGLNTWLDVRIYRKQPGGPGAAKRHALRLWDELSRPARPCADGAAKARSLSQAAA